MSLKTGGCQQFFGASVVFWDSTENDGTVITVLYMEGRKVMGGLTQERAPRMLDGVCTDRCMYDTAIGSVITLVLRFPALSLAVLLPTRRDNEQSLVATQSQPSIMFTA